MQNLHSLKSLAWLQKRGPSNEESADANDIVQETQGPFNHVMRTSSSADICANCGKSSSEDTKLKKCTACFLVKYCSVECQKIHRKLHKRECKRRAAELKDEELFTKGRTHFMGDCPICLLPIPPAYKGRERCMIWPKLPLGTSAGVLQGGKERTKRGKSCCVTFQERVAETFPTLFLD